MSVYPNGLKTPPRITGPYGWRINPVTHVRQFHTGTDSVGHPDGNNHAPEAGVVIFAGYNGGAGNEVRIRAASGTVYRLKHHRSISVRVGQHVAEGQITGPTGTTGQSTGVHCHTEAWPGSTYVDPYPYIAARLGSTAGTGGTGTLITRKENDMTTLYAATLPPLAEIPADIKALGWTGSGKLIWMLVGESPGTPLNAQLTQGGELANQWAATHGGALQASIPLSWPQFLAWYRDALKPLAIAGGGGGGSIPGTIELGPETRAELVGAIASAADSLNPPDRK